jgi:outer membrane protein
MSSQFALRARTWLAALIALVACTLIPTSAAADSPKIAVIDLNRAIKDTEDGIRVDAQLQELYDARQSEFEKKEQELKEAKAEYDQLVQSGKAKQTVLRKKMMALEKMAYELQVAQYNYRREMQQKEYQLKQPIIKSILQLVRRLASKQGYEMVLNKEAVPFFRSDLDITERIVQMYNVSRASTKPKTAPKSKKPAGKAKPKKPTKTGGAKSSKEGKAPRKQSKASKSKAPKKQSKASKSKAPKKQSKASKSKAPKKAKPKKKRRDERAKR